MKLAKALTLSGLAALCISSQPAQATDFVKNLLQQFSGTVASWDDLDNRRTVLDTQISQAGVSGKLSAQDVLNLRNQLKPLADASVQGRASGRSLSFTQGLLYAQTLNSVTANLQQAVATAQSALPDIDALQNELGQNVDSAQSANQITSDDAIKFKAELKTVADIENTIKTTGDGSLSAKQVDNISTRLADIKSRLAQAITTGQSALPELANRRQALQTVVNQALSDKRITDEQARDLLAQLNAADQHRLLLTSSGQTLSGKQILDLASEIDAVSMNLQTAVNLTARNLQQALQAQQNAQNQASQTNSASQTNATAPQFDPNAAVGPMASNAYKDVVGYWAEPYVSNLASRGILGGFPDGTFHPNDNITRAQFAAIAVKALNVPPNTGASSFNDVASKYWAANAIAAVSSAGLVTGFPNGTFAPEDKLTRAQALVILAKALGAGYSNPAELGNYSDASAIPTWALPSVTRAASAHIIVNFPDAASISPNALATRGEVAALMYQTLLAKGKPLPRIVVGLLPQFAQAAQSANNSSGSAPTVQTTVVPTNTAPAMPAAPATVVPAVMPLSIYRVEVAPVGRLQAGDVLTVRVYGSAGGQANYFLRDGEALPMTEKSGGLYEGNYTVRRSDNLAKLRVKAVLSKDGMQPVSDSSATEISLDAKAPELEITPRPNSSISAQPSIVVHFNDGVGSGVDAASVKLFINNQDVTGQSIVDAGMIAYRPTAPLSGNVSAEIKVSDLAGNAVDYSWNFIAPTPAQ